MKTFSMTHIGQRREMNQDYMFTSETAVGNLPNLFLVADGMGGHAAGDYASRFTVEKLVELIGKSGEKEPVAIMKSAVSMTNSLLLTEAQADPAKNGMGTTIVAATVIGNTLYAANVGDSRLYLIGRDIRQITRDHSLVEDMVRMGVLEREEARTHYKKNVITKAIGVADDKTSTPDIFEIEVENGDKLLLCSDGLTNMVEEYDIKKIVKDNDSIEDAVRELIKQANENGGKDNISAILIEPEIGEE